MLAIWYSDLPEARLRGGLGEKDRLSECGTLSCPIMMAPGTESDFQCPCIMIAPYESESE